VFLFLIRNRFGIGASVAAVLARLNDANGLHGAAEACRRPF
jgi:hypothetical protein